MKYRDWVIIVPKPDVLVGVVDGQTVTLGPYNVRSARINSTVAELQRLFKHQRDRVWSQWHELFNLLQDRVVPDENAPPVWAGLEATE